MDAPSDGPPNAIEIQMAATPQWLSVARTVAERLAAQADFHPDAIEDIRLAVDEACTAAAAQTRTGATIRCVFTVAPGHMDIEISTPAGHTPAPFAPLAWRLLRALTDSLTLRHHPGHQFTLRLSKRSP
jgi:serine/threonine-protein kinase RsbW